MAKKKKLTLENVTKKLNKAGAIHIPLSEDIYLIFYTRIVFETIESENNIFQPTTEKVKGFIPSYFIITSNDDFQKNNDLCSAIININTKMIFEKQFITKEIIDFFEEYIF